MTYMKLLILSGAMILLVMIGFSIKPKSDSDHDHDHSECEILHAPRARATFDSGPEPWRK